MQWNCPHCGITLAVTEETLGSGWSFSRCYKCGGFALVRRAEINVIKVDKAPPGERVILPEGSVDPKVNTLNREAAEKMAKVQPAPKKTTWDMTAPTQYSAPQPGQMPSAASAAAISMNQMRLTDPLPHFPIRPWYLRALPYGILISGSLAAISAIYMVVYGTSLWQKVRDDRPVLPSRASALQELPLAKEVITDQLKQAAMAPVPIVRSPQEIEANKEVPVAKAMAAPVAQAVQSVQETRAEPAIAVAAPPKLPKFEPKTALLLVEPTVPVANIHSGPGITFPVIAKTNRGGRYVVKEWNDKWLKIERHGPAGATQVAGWVQNNLLKTVP